MALTVGGANLVVTLALFEANRRRSNVQRAEDAEGAAKTRAIAEEAKAATRDQADALRRLADLAVAQAEPTPIMWGVQWSAGSTYALRNHGTGTAHNVRLETHARIHHWTDGQDIGPGRAATFMVSAAMGTPTLTEVVVRCDEDEEGTAVPI